MSLPQVTENGDDLQSKKETSLVQSLLEGKQYAIFGLDKYTGT